MRPEEIGVEIVAAILAEQMRDCDWEPSIEKPADWDHAYPAISLTGKTLDAMQYLAHWALAQPDVPISVIAASGHVWCFADAIRCSD